MYKKSILALLFFLSAAPSKAMDKVAAQHTKNVPTLADFACQKPVEGLLKMSAEDMERSLNNFSPLYKELLKKFLDKYYPYEPKVQLKQILSGHTNGIELVLFSPDGNIALTGSLDGTVRVWDLSLSPITSKELNGHTQEITYMEISTDNRFVLTASRDGTARLWDLTKSPLTGQELKGLTDRIRTAALSRDGRFALTGSDQGTARLWDLTKSPATSQELNGHTNSIRAAAFSPNGHFALTGSSDNTARLWDLTHSPITSRELRGHTEFIGSVAFSSGGRFASTSALDTTSRVWDLSQSLINSQVLEGAGIMEKAIFSPDERFVLTGSRPNNARLWDLTKNPATSLELIGHTQWVASMAFSPNGRFALTGSIDNTARLWDLAKSPISSQELKGHKKSVRSVAVSPDGRFALTGSMDNNAMLWHLEYIDKTLSILDHLLILKLTKYEDLLMNDSSAVGCLKMLLTKPDLNPQVKKLIEALLYRMQLPEQECCICTEKYDPEARICMRLACCPETMCAVCLHRLGRVSYSTESERFQFDNSADNRCPFCRTRTGNMGTIRKFKRCENEDTHS